MAILLALPLRFQIPYSARNRIRSPHFDVHEDLAIRGNPACQPSAGGMLALFQNGTLGPTQNCAFGAIQVLGLSGSTRRTACAGSSAFLTSAQMFRS